MNILNLYCNIVRNQRHSKNLYRSPELNRQSTIQGVPPTPLEMSIEQNISLDRTCSKSTWTNFITNLEGKKSIKIELKIKIKNYGS